MLTQGQVQVFTNEELNQKYDTLAKYSDPLAAPEREIVGREYEISQLMAAMNRPELCNALLLAPPGSGKTALVQAAMQHDTARAYMEVDLARMIAGLSSSDEMAAVLKKLFDQAETFSKQEQQQLVLFIDEFHQVVQLSAAAVEALKPVLAASGARGIRVIAATTFDEFHQYIAPNQPLVERLQRINVAPPNQATTVKILKGMAQRYGVADLFYDDHMFELIYEYTERYMPASTQPRKSILVLDSMVGWHRHTNRPMDRTLLADVLMESTNVNIAFRVDAVKIKQQLDSKVFSQDLATSIVSQRLQLCVADLNDKTKPMSSFLLTGSTGVGKAVADDELVPVPLDVDWRGWKRHGDLVPGDKVFNRKGEPVEVLGVFPQGEREVYRVTLADGRQVTVDGNHLWGVRTHSDRLRGVQGPFRTIDTRSMYEKGLAYERSDGRRSLRYYVPANRAVQRDEKGSLGNDSFHPYVVGAVLGNGSFSNVAFEFSSADEETVAKVAELMRTEYKATSGDNYTWVFPFKDNDMIGRAKHVQASNFHRDYLEGVVELSPNRSIPEVYLKGSVEERWALVQGLFDTDGCVSRSNGRYQVSYSTSSLALAEGVRRLLFSLGVASTLGAHERERDGVQSTEYTVRVKSSNELKERFFSLSRKVEIAREASSVRRDRVKKFDLVGIRDIEKLDAPTTTTCIYIDDEEHLYQVGDYIVTHNTELTKQLARLLFGDNQGHLIRFDMSEFARNESLDLFRSELAKRVWNMGHSVLLFDEIEKASELVTRVLLQVLDDGRLTDDNGRQVSFLNSYIVMTTNAGSEIFETISQYNVDDTGSGKELLERMKEIRRSISTTQGIGKFPPELLGRIDAIVPFQPLSRETQRKVVWNKLRQMVQEVMSKHGVRVKVSDRVLSYLIDDKVETDSNAGGARAAISKLTSEVTTAVAAFINAHPAEKVIRIDVVGTMRNEDKTLLKSDSYVEVSAAR